jgi:hypothetical protein
MKLRGAILTGLAFLFALAGASAPPATAEDAIVFEPGYAIWLPVYPVGAPSPYEGDTMVILGRVAEFGGPLADLNHRPHPEYTYVISDLVSGGWTEWFDPIPPGDGGWFVEFTGGVLRIYKDSANAANYDNRSTFSNGEVLFEADCTRLVIGYIPGIDLPEIHFTGGTLFDRVSKDGAGLPGTLDWSFDTDEVPADLTALGYRGLVTGVVQVNFPVGVEPATWGRLKALYDH